MRRARLEMGGFDQITIDQSFTGVRWMATALSGFGVLALVLATIGLCGVIAYRVSLRTQEIGVRMALGAGRGAIVRDVVRQGLRSRSQAWSSATSWRFRLRARSHPCRRASDPALLRPTSRRLLSGSRSPLWPAICPPVARHGWIPWKPCGTSDELRDRLAAGHRPAPFRAECSRHDAAGLPRSGVSAHHRQRTIAISC